MLRVYASVAAVAVTALVAGTYLYSELRATDTCDAGTVAGADIGGRSRWSPRRARRSRRPT